MLRLAIRVSLTVGLALAACSGDESQPQTAQGGSSGQGGGSSGGTGGGTGGTGGAGGAGAATTDAPSDPLDVGAGDLSAGDMNVRSDGTSVFDDASVNCNDLINVGPVIAGQKVAANFPTPQGGTIAVGTYYETAYTVYTGPGGAAGPEGVDHQMTAIISGAMARVVVLSDVQHRYTFRIATSGTTTTWTFLCPTGLGSIPYGFDASASEITLYVTTDPANQRTFTLTRQ